MDERHLHPDLAQHSEKKLYTPPCLTVYGLVQDITAGSGGNTADIEGSIAQEP